MHGRFRSRPGLGAGGPARTLATAAAVGLLLSGCVHDAAAYLFDAEQKHAITLIRSQDWFWKDTVQLAIVVDRLPDCQDGLTVEDVPRRAPMELYRPEPGVYAEAIYILQIERRHYAVSPLSCRAQAFDRAPDEKGALVGVFREESGRLRFEPAGGAADGHTLR